MRSRRSLLDQVRRFLRRHTLGVAPLVVAVSGGPDSVALLRALLALRAEGVAPLLVLAHLNHQLRGPESDADEAFLRDLHAALAADEPAALQLRVDRLDVRQLARARRANLEATARAARYDWLVRVARETGAALIATGHTADDQAETVLHHLLRGAGLKGLRGIAARRRLAADVELLRPLLGVRRAEVLEYLGTLGQPFREDSSNADLAYTRNRIRHELLPHLAERYNPALVTLLGRLARQAGGAYALIEQQAARLLQEAELPRAGSVLVFDHTRLAAAPRPLLRELFRLVWAREDWPQGAMTFRHWQRLVRVAGGKLTAADLPGGVRARHQGRVVRLERDS